MESRTEAIAFVRLLLDEMLSPRVAEQLRTRGNDVIAVSESAALRQQPDQAIFEHAQRESRIVVTKNIRDFRILGQRTIVTGESHCGLVLVSDRRFPGHDPRSTGWIVVSLHRLLMNDPDLTDAEHWLT